VEKAADGEKKRMRKPPVFTNLRALQSRFASDASLPIYNFIIDNNSLFDRVMSQTNPEVNDPYRLRSSIRVGR
jgi:hypothetical protein